MKRLLVRLSALTGVVAVGLCTLFAAQRLVPRAEAQEPDRIAAPTKRHAQSAPGKGPTKQRSGAKAKNKKAAVPAGRRADSFAGEPTADRYAASVDPPNEPRAFDDHGSSLEPLDSSEGANAAGRYAPARCPTCRDPDAYGHATATRMVRSDSGCSAAGGIVS